MPRAKQIELAAKPMALVEYAVNGVRWRCNHFDQLAAEINVTDVEHLTLFHDQVSVNERPWMIVRRLFGMQPVVPPSHFDLEDLRDWERRELCDKLGITKAQLQEELAAVQGAWMKIAPKKPEPETVKETPKAPDGEFHFAEEERLRKYGFTTRFADREQATWFAGRVKDYEKLLNEAVTAGLAHNALMTELQIRRFDDYFADPRSGIGTGDWRANLKVRGDLDKTYREQMDQILEKAPWASAVVGKYALGGQISDITKSIQDYLGRGDSALIDGMFTALEIKVECRRSVQTPAPRYRAGLVVHAAAAKAGLWDPHWKGQFTPAELKRLDLAWREAFVAACQETGEPLVDLEKDGPGGEYPELREETK